MPGESTANNYEKVQNRHGGDSRSTRRRGGAQRVMANYTSKVSPWNLCFGTAEPKFYIGSTQWQPPVKRSRPQEGEQRNYSFRTPDMNQKPKMRPGQ
jgi:hypothetical protein